MTLEEFLKEHKKQRLTNWMCEEILRLAKDE